MEELQIDHLANSRQAVLAESDFVLFRDFILQRTGIFLGPMKRVRLDWRLRKRVRSLGINSFKAYYDLLRENQDEAQIFIESICTHETRFFREPYQLEFLKNSIFPEWQSQAAAATRERNLRVWCAGCASGEEPYSIAMMLQDQFAALPWHFEVVASDISMSILEKASRSVWPLTKAGEIPQGYLKKFMLKGVGNQVGKIKVAPELRALVAFQQINLNDDQYPLNGKFDLILCRNVLIYFSKKVQAEVIEKIKPFLTDDGYLFLGHAENLVGIHGMQRTPTAAVYRRSR